MILCEFSSTEMCSAVLLSIGKIDFADHRDDNFGIALCLVVPYYYSQEPRLLKVYAFSYCNLMSSLGNRREADIVRLMMNDFTVKPINDRTDEFYVIFRGPNESLYEGGVWKLHVELAVDYPYKPPRVAFMNKIFHPNINENSGSICLNVMNEAWSPLTDLVNVFDVFLPQLLLNPNDSHGLNEDAIFLLMSDTEKFEQTVKDYCKRYAKEEDIIDSSSGVENTDEDVSEDEDASNVDESSDAMAGHLEL